MKKLCLLITALVLMACQQDKIGFVDNVKIMDGYQEKIDLENMYKKRGEVFSKKKDSISQAFQLEVQELQTRSQRMSKKKAQEEMGLLQQKSQFIGQQLRQEEEAIQIEGQTQMDSLIKKVKSEIETYGKTNGFTYILGGGEGGSVLYGNEAKDLTDPILKILNDKYQNK